MPITSPLRHPDRTPSPWAARGWAVAACLLTTALTLPLHDRLDPVNTVMLFLLTVALVASRLGKGPAVLAAFLSVAIFDFGYVAPRWSLAVSDAQYLLTFGVMLAVALIISHLAEGWRQQAMHAQARAEETHALYDLARTLASCLSSEQIEVAAAGFVASHLHADLRILTASPDGALTPLTSGTPTMDTALALAADAVYLDDHAPDVSHLAFEGPHHLLSTLQGATRRRGVLIISTRDESPVPLQATELVRALASLVAASIERLHFVDVAQQTQVEITTERLRGSILSALSHDIRTPLTALYGTADALALTQPPLPAAAQDMARSVRDQAMHLHDMVVKLLDMARLHTGHVAMHQEWQPLEEVIGASIQSLGSALAHHPIKVTLPPDLPLVCIDAVLFERVLANLLENAAKYSPAGLPIDILAGVEGERWVLRVRDAGPGFPPDKLGSAFKLFERGVPESSVPGVGLGLAICQAIVEAHEGRIEAHNLPGKGAELRISLPLGTPPALEPEAEA